MLTFNRSWTAEACLPTTAAARALQSTLAWRDGLEDCSKILAFAFSSTPFCIKLFILFKTPSQEKRQYANEAADLNEGLNALNESSAGSSDEGVHGNMRADHFGSHKKLGSSGPPQVARLQQCHLACSLVCPTIQQYLQHLNVALPHCSCGGIASK